MTNIKLTLTTIDAITETPRFSGLKYNKQMSGLSHLSPLEDMTNDIHTELIVFKYEEIYENEK